MNFKSFISKLFLAGIICSVAACSDDETAKVVEGLPASLSFSIALPANDSVNVLGTRASAESESTVENLVLLFYKDGTTKPVSITVDGLKSSGGTNDSYREYSITVPETSGLTSGTWYVYGVANYNKQFVNVGSTDITTLTKDQMDEFCTYGTKDLDFVETGVLLSGKYRDYTNGDVGEITLNPGSNELKGEPIIVLKRAVAKNEFNFKNGDGVTFTPTSYTVYKLSTSSTLMEREGWKAYPSSLGHATTTSGIGDPQSLTYKGNADSFTNSVETPISNSTFTFYCQENVQMASGLSDYHEREAHNSASDQTFKNAPENATYVVVKGTYADNTYEGTVTYTIHLGDFSSNGGSYNNFTVRRNVKYTYNVTVNGVNSIETEVNATDFSENQPGAEGDLVNKGNTSVTTLDAHYEQVLINLGTVNTLSNLSQLSLYLNTPYTKGKEYTSSTSDWGDADINWVEFGIPNYTTSTSWGTTTTLNSSSPFRPYSYYFSSANNKRSSSQAQSLCNIQELMSELISFSGSSTNHLLVSGGNVYVVAYVNEYYYDGKTTELSKFINADNRVMTLGSGVKKSLDGKSSITSGVLFSLSQRSIKSPFNFDGSYFGVETVEEQSAATNSTYNCGSDQLDGWTNYATQFTPGTSNWSTYVNQNTNGYISGTYSNGLNRSYRQPYYYCLTRNRDNNGNGTIDADEMRWYLPAQEQCIFLYCGYNMLPTEAKLSGNNYLTSTSTYANWYQDEGTAFGGYSTSFSYNVRAVRNLKNNNGTTETIYSYDQNSRTFTIKGLNESSMRTSSMTGEYQKHTATANANKLYSKWQIAPSYNSQTYDADEVLNDTPGTDYDGNSSDWRVPNAKELALMSMVLNTSTSPAALDWTASRTTYSGNTYTYNNVTYETPFYWRISGTNQPLLTSGTNIWAESYGKGNVRVLCVRDVTSSSAKSRKASAVKSKKH